MPESEPEYKAVTNILNKSKEPLVNDLIGEDLDDLIDEDLDDLIDEDFV